MHLRFVLEITSEISGMRGCMHTQRHIQSTKLSPKALSVLACAFAGEPGANFAPSPPAEDMCATNALSTLRYPAGSSCKCVSTVLPNERVNDAALSRFLPSTSVCNRVHMCVRHACTHGQVLIAYLSAQPTNMRVLLYLSPNCTDSYAHMIVFSISVRGFIR